MSFDSGCSSYEQFCQSLADPQPPAHAELALRALWFDANGLLESAMRTAESDRGHFGKRVLGYLHRKAGDDDEAHLWYWRAGTRYWEGSPESEWQDIVRSVLAERVVANAYI